MPLGAKVTKALDRTLAIPACVYRSGQFFAGEEQEGGAGRLDRCLPTAREEAHAEEAEGDEGGVNPPRRLLVEVPSGKPSPKVSHNHALHSPTENLEQSNSERATCRG
jgi:hypothetical protein